MKQNSAQEKKSSKQEELYFDPKYYEYLIILGFANPSYLTIKEYRDQIVSKIGEYHGDLREKTADPILFQKRFSAFKYIKSHLSANRRITKEQRDQQIRDQTNRNTIPEGEVDIVKTFITIDSKILSLIEKESALFNVLTALHGYFYNGVTIGDLRFEFQAHLMLLGLFNVQNIYTIQSQFHFMTKELYKEKLRSAPIGLLNSTKEYSFGEVFPNVYKKVCELVDSRLTDSGSTMSDDFFTDL